VAAPYLCYLLIALVITGHLWIHQDVRVVSTNRSDNDQFLWFLSNAAYSLTHGHNPLITDRLNVPGQVNLMGNTSVLGLGIPLAPVTLLFGVPVTFALALMLGLAGTASSWYWVLSRHVVRHRLAAFVGAGFCGFAPGMVAQSAGHPNLTAQFLVPLIVWGVVRLRESGRTVRNGVILGLLITYQVFLNEEILLLTALACACFVGVYALLRWSEIRGSVRPFLAGLATAALTAGTLLAYPLWVQFFGPGHYHGLPPGVERYTVDLASYPAFAGRTLAGSDAVADRLTLSANEENFLGWPLLIFTIVAVVLMWRRRLVWALASTGLGFLLLSLGPKVTVDGHKTQIPGPQRVLRHIPPFELVTSTRYALVVTPVVGILLALACAALIDWMRTDRRRIALVVALVAAVLLPIAPKPLKVAEEPVPAFILNGEWRRYVDDGHTLVSVPVPHAQKMQGMRWAALAGIGFAVPRGYFMGPTNPQNGRAAWDPQPRPTSTLLFQISNSGHVPLITDIDRVTARSDLRYWRAAVVVVAGTEPHAAALVTTMNNLIGPGTWDDTGGVWLWDVRSLNP
jgi:hypothetical protein